MEDNREAGNAFFNLFEDVEPKGRRYEYTLRIAGALFWPELVRPVRCAYRDGEGIHTRLGDEIHHLVGFGVGMVFGRYFVFDTGQNAEFSFDRYVELVAYSTTLRVSATFSS